MAESDDRLPGTLVLLGPTQVGKSEFREPPYSDPQFAPFDLGNGLDPVTGRLLPHARIDYTKYWPDRAAARRCKQLYWHDDTLKIR